jgi:hypothetical protein
MVQVWFEWPPSIHCYHRFDTQGGGIWGVMNFETWGMVGFGLLSVPSEGIVGLISLWIPVWWCDSSTHINSAMHSACWCRHHQSWTSILWNCRKCKCSYSGNRLVTAWW